MLRLVTSEVDWPEAERFIAAGCQRGPIQNSKVEDLRQSCAEGKNQLWVVQQGGKILAAAVTAIVIEPQGSILEVIAAGGVGIPDYVEPMASWARSMGCKTIRLIGRRGWSRKLSDFQVKGVIMEKAI